jgi:hypothetical protein
MGDYAVGYGKPPRSGRFKPGASGNPNGRPKRKPLVAGEIIGGTLSGPMTYRDRGQTIVTTRLELSLKLLIDSAVAGDLRAAEDVLRFRTHALRFGDTGVEWLEISDWLPDHSGQTGEQKTRIHLERDVADGAQNGGERQ